MTEIKYPPNESTPTAHHTTHEPGGLDEVFGIPAAPHAASHLTGADLLPDATGVARGLMSAAFAGKVNAQFFIDPNSIHVDKNRTDVYTEDGSPTFPYKTIQAGVTHAETTATSSNPVMVMVEPGNYDENVVIHKDGVHLRARGTPYDTMIVPTTGSGLTFTNATALSLGVYNTSGNYADLVNQGDAGPMTNGIWGISVSSPVGNAFPPIRLLGVKGDTAPGTTGFAFGLYMEHCAFVTANAVAPPLYIRNANTVFLDVECYVMGTAPITIINANKVNLSNSLIVGDVSSTWDSADVNGTPSHTTNKYLYGMNSQMNNLLLSGEAKVDDAFSWDINQDMTLSGTSVCTCYECLVRNDLTIGAGCAFNFKASGVLGDITISATAAACVMDGGDLMGITTDPGGHLTRNITKHQTTHVTGNDQIPDASAITRGLLTPAQLAVVTTMNGHLHTAVDGTGKIDQASSHQSPDTDVGPTSLHHTLGTGANQAASGTHDHTTLVRTDGTRGMIATGSVVGAGTVSTVGSSTTVTTTGNAFAALAEWDTITANGKTVQVFVKTDNNTVTVSEAVDWSAGFAWTWNQALHLHFSPDASDRTECGILWNDTTGASTWQLYTWFGENEEFLGFYNARAMFDVICMTEAGRISINRTSDANPRIPTIQAPAVFSVFPQRYAHVLYTMDNAAFADNTTEAATSVGTPFTFLDQGIADRTKNWTYLAMSRKWQTCWLEFTTFGETGWTTHLEYWKTGAGWTPMVLSTDGTANYTQTGAITWDKKNPGGTGDDWGQTTTVAGYGNYYWIRIGSLTVPAVSDVPKTQAIGPNAIPRISVYQSALDSTPRLFINPQGRISLGGSELVGESLLQLATPVSGTIVPAEAEALAAFYSDDPTRNAVILQLSDASSAYPVLGLANSRGSLTAPAALADGDRIGGLEFFGRTDAWTETCEINGEVDGTPGSGDDLPSRLVFKTTPSGGGSLVEQFRISSTGLVSTAGTMQAAIFQGGSFKGSLDTDVAAAKLTISGSSVTAGGTDANVNVNLAPKGTGTVDVASKRITNVLDPTAAQDAATKNYVGANFSLTSHTHATLPTVGEKNDLQYINYIKANGFSTNAGVVDNLDGTVTIPTESVWLSPGTTSLPAALYTLTGGITGSGGIPAIPDGVASYIIGDWNGGVPKFNLITDVELIDEMTIVPYVTLFREGTVVHTLTWDLMGVSLVNKLHQRLVKTDRFARESGLILGEDPGRVVTITLGKAWNGGTRVSLDAFNSAINTMGFWYHVAGVWTETTPIQQYNNLQYDDGTNLQTLGAGKWVVNWVYRDQGVAAEAHVVLSTQYDNVSAAMVAPIPTTKPPILTSHGFLVGAIIVQQGASTGLVTSSWTTQFAAGTVMNHDDLSNISGGAAGDRQHLTTTQVGYLPTANQKAALAGTSGTAPSVSNKFVDNSDTRNSDARTPVDHSHNGVAGQGSKLTQANSHQSPDTDVAAASLHHTLGVTSTQAATGNHAHTGADGVKLAQANTHQSPDTDSATTSLHHTVGTGATQASSGTHNHDGLTAVQLLQANTHQTPDTDVGPTSLHHTLGTGANQATAGTHNHDGTTAVKLVQANTHQTPDTDTNPNSLHHTLGTGSSQAAAGNHLHTGVYTGVSHAHTGAVNDGPVLVQSSTHASPDTDSALTALHHTLGTGANQSAAGNHLHTGVYPPVAHNHDGTGNNGPILAQANTHSSPDTDLSATALHHTLGTGAFQAAAGNHGHTKSQITDFVEANYVHTTGNETVAGNKTFTGQTIKSVGGLVCVNGNNHDVAIGNATLVRITGPTGNYVITGVAGGVDGREIILYNTVAFRLTINNDDAGSLAANRILTLTGANLQTNTIGAFRLVYDGTGSRWIVTDWQA